MYNKSKLLKLQQKNTADSFYMFDIFVIKIQMIFLHLSSRVSTRHLTHSVWTLTSDVTTMWLINRIRFWCFINFNVKFISLCFMIHVLSVIGGLKVLVFLNNISATRHLISQCVCVCVGGKGLPSMPCSPMKISEMLIGWFRFGVKNIRARANQKQSRGGYKHTE